MIENLIVLLIVGAAAWHAYGKYLRPKAASGCASGCGSCKSGCETPAAPPGGHKVITIRRAAE